MYKLRKLFFVNLLIISNLNSISQIQDSRFLKKQNYKAEEIRFDLKLLKNRLELLHPNLYKYTSQKDFNKFCDSLEKSITSEQSLESSYLKFITLVKQVRCGHTAILPDSRLVAPSTPDLFLKQPVFFPFDVNIIKNQVFVSRNYSSSKDLDFGAEILEIEGIKVSDLIDSLKKYNYQIGDGFNQNAEVFYIQRHFSTLFYLFRDELKEINIKYKSAKNQKIIQERITLLGKFLIGEIAAERYPVRRNDDFSNLSYQQIDFETARIRIRSFTEDESFFAESFTEETKRIFKKIEEEKIKNLIIDLRANGGGNLVLMESILAHLILKPSPRGNLSMKKWTYETLEKTDKPLISILRKKVELMDGRYYEKTMRGYLKPSEKHKFSGKSFVLISSSTYSAAAFLAAKLQDLQISTLVGSQAGGAKDGASAGSFTRVILPKTKLEVMIPIFDVDYRLDSKNVEEKAIKPDFEVKRTVDDFLNNRDAVMDFTLELIKKEKK